MTSIYSIDLDSRDPATAFTRLTEFPSPRHPILLHGSHFFSANVANNTIHVINAETGKMICVLYPPKIGSDSILGAIEVSTSLLHNISFSMFYYIGIPPPWCGCLGPVLPGIPAALDPSL